MDTLETGPATTASNTSDESSHAALRKALYQLDLKARDVHKSSKDIGTMTTRLRDTREFRTQTNNWSHYEEQCAKALEWHAKCLDAYADMLQVCRSLNRDVEQKEGTELAA